MCYSFHEKITCAPWRVYDISVSNLGRWIKWHLSNACLSRGGFYSDPWSVKIPRPILLGRRRWEKNKQKVVRLSDEEPGAYTVPGTPVPVRLSLPLLLFPFSSSPPQARRSTMSSLFSVSAPRYIEFLLHGVKELRIRISSSEEKVHESLRKKKSEKESFGFRFIQNPRRSCPL